MCNGKTLFISVVLFFILLITGCSMAKQSSCAKRYMSNQKFIYLSPNGQLTSKYFLIKDSVQFEYSGSSLYSESSVNWVSCNEYSLILKRIYYEEKGLQPGDTLFVRLQFFDKDTVICNATAYNRTFSFKLLRGITEEKK
jgi:hypothetical protein